MKKEMSPNHGTPELSRTEKPNEDVGEMIEKSRRELQDAFNAHFKEFDPELHFDFSLPSCPEKLTTEHLGALERFFGSDKLKPILIPTLAELKNLDTPYTRVMYQGVCPGSDGLPLYNTSQFEDRAELEGFDFQNETWQEAYLRNMRREIQALNGSLVLVETIQKPNNIHGSQQYGTKEGTDSTKDPLLAIIHKTLGKNANRFNHSWDDLQTKLIPKIKERIKKLFQDQGLSIPDFEVQLCPASIFNLETTLFNPQIPTTNTSEWTSTALMDAQNKDSGNHLSVGISSMGGASNIVAETQRYGHAHMGFRLAVVFPPANKSKS